MQAGTPVPKKPIVQPQEQPAAPPRNTAAHNDTVIIPTSRPRYTQTERRAMLEEVQRRQAERGRLPARPRPAPRGAFPHLPRQGIRQARLYPGSACPAAPAQQPAAEDARTLQMPAVQPAAPAPQAAPQPKVTAPQPVQTAPQPAAAPAPKHKRTAPANSYKGGRGRAERAHPRRPHPALQPGCRARAGPGPGHRRRTGRPAGADALHRRADPCHLYPHAGCGSLPPDRQPFPPGHLLLYRSAALHSHLCAALRAVRRRSHAAGHLSADPCCGTCHRQAHGIFRA